jgi:hypothetical protein
MPDGLSPERLERIRRSLGMSGTLPSKIGKELLDEVQRLRAVIARVDGEVETAIGRYPAAGTASFPRFVRSRIRVAHRRRREEHSRVDPGRRRDAWTWLPSHCSPFSHWVVAAW